MSISRTHEEYLQSLRDNDGKKFIVYEANETTGEAGYLEIPKNPYETGKIGPAEPTEKETRARKRRNITLQRTARKINPYTWRLSYNHCSAQYTGDSNPAILSGSSLNRKAVQNFYTLARGGGIMYKRKPVKKTDQPAIHVMSKRTKGKIRDKATAFFRSVKERKFLTLTFIEHVSDQEGRKILNKFLTVARKDIPGFHNLTVAEHQPERDTHTIHFHILTNRRLCIRRFNALWVLQQYNSGLTGHRANGAAIGMGEIAARYNDGTIGEVLNPAQIERAYSISLLKWYLTKYVTKQTTDEKFGCLTWHCSRKVSRLFTAQIVGPSAFAFLQSFRNYKLDRSTGEVWAPRQIEGAFYKVIFVNNAPVVLDNLQMMEQANAWIMEGMPTDRRWGDMRIKPGDYQRIYIGKDQRFDRQAMVREIVGKKYFLQPKNSNDATTTTIQAGRENVFCES